MKNNSITLRLFLEFITHSALSDREKTVLIGRLRGKTLKQISKTLKPLRPNGSSKCVSPERIRAIEYRSLNKLKALYNAKIFTKLSLSAI